MRIVPERVMLSESEASVVTRRAVWPTRMLPLRSAQG